MKPRVNILKVFRTHCVCVYIYIYDPKTAAKRKHFFGSGEDVRAEESFVFSGFRGDSDPLPVPGPLRGCGPPQQMVHCLKYNSIVLICFRIIQLQLISWCDLSNCFLCFDWQV